MAIFKNVILICLTLLLPVAAVADLTVKFFPGYSFHHQADEIHDGAITWAIIKQNDSYVLTKRTIRLKSFNSPNRDDQGQPSGRELVSPDADSDNFVKEVGRFTDGEW